MKNKFLLLTALGMVSVACRVHAQPFAKNISPISAASVSFYDDTHGFAVGDRGKILSTTDGGHTWDHKQTSRHSHFTKVKFFDQNLGVVIGEDSTFLVTHNGGASWQATAINADLSNGSTFYDFWFADANTWFLTGNEIVLKTTNAGATWTNTLSNVFNQVPVIAFSDAQHGFFATNGGYTLYTSTDGGNTWSLNVNLSITSAVKDMHFFDNSTAVFALTDGSIVRTTDGGVTFNPVYVGTGSMNAFSFSNGQNGYCVGNAGKVLKTTDAGATWSAVPGLSTTYNLNAAHATSSGGEFYGDFGLRVRTDGGTASLESEWPFELATVSGVAFHSEQLGLACGTRYTTDQQSLVLRTTDGGSTWKRSVIPASGVSFTALHFINASTVYAIGSNANLNTDGIYLSTDSGKTFATPVTIPAMAGQYVFWADMANYGSDTLFVTGNQAAYGTSRSYDGGATWTSGDISSYGYDLTMENSQTGFVAGGGGGDVTVTNDAWATFAASIVGAPQGPKAIDYGSGSTLYTADAWANIFKTSDNGSSWSSIRTGNSQQSIAAMDFSDASTGFLVGSNFDGTFGSPYILHTTDGGATFQVIDAAYNFDYIPNALQSLSMLNASTGFAAGEASNLFKICNTCNASIALGVNEVGHNPSKQLTLYPNPANELLTIECNGTVKTAVCVNCLGQVMPAPLTNKTLDVSALASGMYFLTVTRTDGETSSARFVKQ